jgi:Rrf2 family nitric oxide-sensitive transcriptional repressor
MLVRLGYIHSLRSRGGGLNLAKPIIDINLGEVVRQTENLQLLECFGENSTYPIVSACNLKRVLVNAQREFLNVLDQYSLADLTTNRLKLRKLLDVA